MRGPGRQKPWNLPDFAQARPPAWSDSCKDKWEGGWWAWHRSGGTEVMGGARAPGWAHQPDTAATLPSHPLPSLGGSDPPTDPAPWGFQMQTAVVSREASNLGTLSPKIDPRDPLHSYITHHFQTDPQRPQSLITTDLQGDSRGPHCSDLQTDPFTFPITT